MANDDEKGKGGATSRSARPIDPPSIPPRQMARPGWGLRAVDEEEEPTENYVDPPPELAPATLLGEETTAVGFRADSAAPTEILPPPEELARRLAEEAKRRLPPAAHRTAPREEPRMTQEDPRELARRLADEAKRRLQSSPPPPPVPVEEPAVVEPEAYDYSAVDEEPFVPPDEEEPQIEMMAPPPAAERATSGRAMTALEALAAARETERTRRSEPSNAPASSSSPQGAGSGSRSPPSKSPPPAPDGPVPVSRAVSVLSEVFGAIAETANPIRNPDVFRALWRAHRARAVHDGDLVLAATASVLLDAVERVPVGYLVAARITVGGQSWAAWVDVERSSLLGVAQPSDVYLAT